MADDPLDEADRKAAVFMDENIHDAEEHPEFRERLAASYREYLQEFLATARRDDHREPARRWLREGSHYPSSRGVSADEFERDAAALAALLSRVEVRGGR